MFSWSNTELGVSQGSILCLLLFLICINDLSDSFLKNTRLLAGDVSFFSVVDNINLPAINFNSGLSKTNVWKMTFNPDPSKQVPEIFFRKIGKDITPSTKL